MVNIALNDLGLTSCPAADIDGDEAVQVAEIIAAVGRALNGCPGSPPTPTPDPLEHEDGWCYESATCLPCDVYPCRPFSANRAYCCHLVRAAVSVPFSWCPADRFDPVSGGSCTQCEYPCPPPSTPSPTPTNPPGSCCCGNYSFTDCQLLALYGSCSGWGDPCPTPTPTPTPTRRTLVPPCGDAAVMQRFAACRLATSESVCIAAGGAWGSYPFSHSPGCLCPTGQGGCACTMPSDCVGKCYTPGRVQACDEVLGGTCSAVEPEGGCWCVFDPYDGRAHAFCNDP